MTTKTLYKQAQSFDWNYRTICWPMAISYITGINMKEIVERTYVYDNKTLAHKTGVDRSKQRFILNDFGYIPIHINLKGTVQSIVSRYGYLFDKCLINTRNHILVMEGFVIIDNNLEFRPMWYKDHPYWRTQVDYIIILKKK